jgi:hypothetical protein
MFIVFILDIQELFKRSREEREANEKINLPGKLTLNNAMLKTNLVKIVLIIELSKL